MAEKNKIKKNRIYTFLQSLVITTKYFFQNELFTFASACAFNFLFSVIPILMIIVSILVRILHASPAAIKNIFQYFPDLQNYINPDSLIESVSKIQIFSSFEIILGIFVIWIARRFFTSIFVSIRKIFKNEQRRRPIVNQTLAVVFEFVIILAVILVTLAFFSLETILSQPIFQKIPELNFIFSGFLSSRIFVNLPNLLIFVSTTLLYIGASGTKPGIKICVISGFLCTFSFWLFRIILHSFLNVNRYNLIYGVLSQAIIFMLDLSFFFSFFLFFAQYIFTFQFFDDLILGELYCHSKQTQNNFLNSIYKKIFSASHFFEENSNKLLNISQGEIIYKDYSIIKHSFYIKKGSVSLFNNKTGVLQTLNEGDFFGEFNCAFEKQTHSTATALTNCELFCVSKESLLNLTEKNSLVASNFLQELQNYFYNDNLKSAL